MRLLVRPAVQVNLSTRFSWDVKSAPEQSQTDCLYHFPYLFSSQTDSKVWTCVNKKRKLSPGPLPPSLASIGLPLVPTCWLPNINGIPLREQECSDEHPTKTDFSFLLGSTNSCPIAVHMKPFPTSVFKVRI